MQAVRMQFERRSAPQAAQVIKTKPVIGLDDPEIRRDVAFAKEEIECLQALTCMQTERISMLEQQVEHLTKLLSGGVTKTAQRAHMLAEAVKNTNLGFVTRTQAREILAEEGDRLGLKVTDDAMKAAAKMYSLVYRKNGAGEVVLGVLK
ncbi:hypothetical protein [Methanolobus chelungpuianus]|uniref:Uncharacterized protein n=1 Tax=Methanolobus chelungpuianus TaxID=502115 RepID=A0AAE3HA35_9EURY|nr:hypothetical protein [Methanolobus chelungpuianus]MCQ6962786.1 hypothetical protein [Methanolobus chelungpuianus]